MKLTCLIERECVIQRLDRAWVIGIFQKALHPNVCVVEPDAPRIHPRSLALTARTASETAVRQSKAQARKRTAQDWLALELERNARQIVAAAVNAAKGGDWRAGAWLYERAYGKPEQRVEVETPDTLAQIQAMTPEERKALRARLLREHPQLLELVPKSERGGPSGQQ